MTENEVGRADGEKKEGRRFSMPFRGMSPGTRFSSRTKQIAAAVALLFVGGAVALLGDRLIGGGSNAENELRITSFKDWRMICPAAQSENARCAISVEVTREQGGTVLAIGLDNPAPGSTMSVTVPLGVLLEPGVGFSAGNDPLRVRPYETCTPAGCIAFVTIDADTLKSLRGNNSGQVVLVPGDGSPVTIPFSLQGFADAYAALQNEVDRRSSMWSFLSR